MESVEIQKQDFPSFHDSLEISRTARDSHISTAPAVTIGCGEGKENDRKVWPMGKWKSQNRIPTFPPTRQPAAARKKNVY
jgi:hypothetical protein